MGIRPGYRVRCPDGMCAVVRETRSVELGSEPCFATIDRPDGQRDVLLRDLVSDPPKPDALVTAEMEMEIAEIDLSGVVRLDQLVGSDNRLVTIKELERRVGA